MKFIDKKTIEIDRELSILDNFTLDFISILKNHTTYVIVSGYVAILLGRSRSSEDIDIIIPKIAYSIFQNLYTDLKKQGFYCINAEKSSDIYNYLEDNLAIRFAKKDTMIPNIEFKWAKTKFDDLALANAITVTIDNSKMNVSQLELQIAFKEMVLKSPKDLEDAEHIKDVAREHLDTKLIKKYKEMLHGFY
jgi:hypothetical protein